VRSNLLYSDNMDVREEAQQLLNIYRKEKQDRRDFMDSMFDIAGIAGRISGDHGGLMSKPAKLIWKFVERRNRADDYEIELEKAARGERNTLPPFPASDPRSPDYNHDSGLHAS